MIYVDKIRSYPKEMISYGAKKFGTDWCHLWGCDRSWFQRGVLEHYDLTPSMREKAVEAGAIPTNLREWFRKKS